MGNGFETGRDMTSILVTGGKQRTGAKGHEEWFSYAEARIMAIDLETRAVRLAAAYESPAEHRPDDPRSNIVFKAGTRCGNRFHVCTQTEVLSYTLPDFSLEQCLSHPWFNDLHHVAVASSGNFLVVLTGLDLVVEMTAGGEVVQEYSALGDDVWFRFDRETDYRKVLTTKPHHAHPNYVFEHEGQIYTTRLEQRDVACLTDRSRGIEPGIEKLHDGVVHGDHVYFTAVDGHVVVADPARGEVVKVHDLNSMTNSDKTLGWCRGIHVMDDNRVLVGFSRLRPSKFKENVRWVKHRVGLRENAGMAGTRIACYDLANGRHEWDLDLEAHDMNAVFSIIPAP